MSADEIIREAKDFAWRALATHNGDPKKAQAEIAKTFGRTMESAGGRVALDDISRNRLRELASAYVGMIDLATGQESRNAGRVATEAWQAALEGREANSRALSLSAQLAQNLEGKHVVKAAEMFGKTAAQFIVKAVGGKAVAAGGFLFALAGVASANTLEEAGKELKKAGQAGLEAVDPSFGLFTAAVTGIPGAVEDIKQNGGRRREDAKVAPNNLAVDRAQKFLFDPNHPGQLGALKMEINGKPVDIAKALIDPSQRQAVLDEISKREVSASSPEMKQQFADMKLAANEFIELEGRRKIAQAPIARVAEAQVTQPAPSMA